MKKQLIFLYALIILVLLFSKTQAQSDISGVYTGHISAQDYYVGWNTAGTPMALNIRNDFSLPIDFWTNTSRKVRFTHNASDVARVGMGIVTTPLTHLHLGLDDLNFGGGGTGYRSWMNIGALMMGSPTSQEICETCGTDQMYVGLKYLGADRSDAIINWGNNPSDDNDGDRLYFVFTAAAGNGVASTTDGIEVSRMWSDGDHVRTRFGYDGALTALDPQNTVHIIGNGSGAVAGGNSGLMFQKLTSSTTTTSAVGNKGVLSVDANGNVIYVSGSSVASITDDFNTDGYLNVTDASGTHPTTRRAWLASGNTGTNPANDFVGTADNADLVFKRNSVKSGLINVSQQNTFFGFSAGLNNSTGANNNAIGYMALNSNTKINNNTALGTQALFSMSYNSAFDGDNTAVGYKALYTNQPTSTSTGFRNTALGSLSLFSNTIGNFNTATGQNALYTNNTGSYNTGTGNASLYYNTTGAYNTANGTNALFNNSTASNNVAMGYRALYNNRNNGNNTAIGTQALFSMSYSENEFNGENVAVGYKSLYSNQPTITVNGNQNTGIGSYTLYSNTWGYLNTASGYNSLYANTTGTYNTASGAESLLSNTTGYSNTAIGTRALHDNTIGMYNEAFGTQALYKNIDGGSNVATGNEALYNNTYGDNNTANGESALNTNTTGNGNTAIGYWADVSSGALQNSTAIGNGTIVNASNKIRLGDGSIQVIEGQVNWSYPSDLRFKNNIKEEVKGLDFIMKLRPVTYNFDTKKFDDFLMKNMPDSIRQKRIQDKDYATSSNIVHTGFIAQEVEKTVNEIGYKFDGLNVPKDDNDNYSLSYSQFVVPLVKAVQELSKTNDSLKNNNKLLEERLNQLEAIVNQCCNLNKEKKSMSYQEVELKNGQAIVLDQNVPNPFAESTTISYFIPDNIGSAQIIFTDNLGRIMKTVDIKEKGQGMLKVYAQDLSSGIYSYTLIADGKTVDSKKMVKTK